MPRQSHVDGKVWTNDVNSHSILRLDLATGAYERVDPFQGMPIGVNRQHSPYGMAADKNNDLYFMDFGDESVGRIDAQDLPGHHLPDADVPLAPTSHNAGRQGAAVVCGVCREQARHVRSRSRKHQGMDAPTPHTYPYDVYLDRNGEL